MTKPWRKVLEGWRANPRRVFLVDGLGALVSAFFLGVVLVILEEKIGMPVSVLRILAGLALLYAIYSLLCYFVMPRPWQVFLTIIAVANFLHCCLTAWLVVVYFEQLTALGRTYFLLEISVVVGLAVFEWSVAQPAPNRSHKP